ncbi:hypothetical protein CYMTET_9289 [Cymbomonas tetramitiformis]|uniref:Uncharacterized protein n=1 Tax=Cymbomonas tetramitiformis TaxID=36881 RepID=A0AAE0GRR9_9CHLO|nr:hypothetical protein CYMTET_9289 [Cymbomonas tetramitiformis]
MRESDLGASISLQAGVRDSPTPVTPTPPAPGAALGTDTAGAVRAAKVAYVAVSKKMTDVYSSCRHRKWANKAMRGHILGGAYVYYFVADHTDIDKLAKLAINVKQENLSAGRLDVDVFNLRLGTDAVLDRNGRRALIDLIKGCVPPTVKLKLVKLQAEHSALSCTPPLTPTSTRPCVCATIVRTDLGGLPLGELKDLVTAAIYVSWQQQQADQGGASGAVLSAAVPTGDDNNLTDMLETTIASSSARRDVLRQLPTYGDPQDHGTLW